MLHETPSLIVGSLEELVDSIDNGFRVAIFRQGAFEGGERLWLPIFDAFMERCGGFTSFGVGEQLWVVDD